MANSGSKQPNEAVLGAEDLALFPVGSASYSETGGVRVYAFRQLGDLDPDVRGEAVALAQMSGWLPNVEPDADLVKLIPL